MWPWRPVPNGHCQIRFNKGIHVRSVFPSPPNPQHLGVCWRVGLRYVALRMPTLLQASYSEAPMIRVPNDCWCVGPLQKPGWQQIQGEQNKTPDGFNFCLCKSWLAKCSSLNGSLEKENPNLKTIIFTFKLLVFGGVSCSIHAWYL